MKLEIKKDELLGYNYNIYKDKKIICFGKWWPLHWAVILGLRGYFKCIFLKE